MHQHNSCSQDSQLKRDWKVGDNDYVPLGCSVAALFDCQGLKPLLIESIKIWVLHELPGKKTAHAVTHLDISQINTKRLSNQVHILWII